MVYLASLSAGIYGLTLAEDEVMEYSNCLLAYDAEYCNTQMYDLCVSSDSYEENSEIEEHCRLFKECLETYEDFDYCDSLFFEDVPV